MFGTPEYMSPEQARGEQAGPQSDLYALGVLFFEMLTGQLPFRASDRETLLEMQRTAPAPRPSTIRKDCHPVAEKIVLRLLEKDPRKRYRDGHHLLEELKALQRSLPSPSWDKEGGPEAAPVRRRRPRRRARRASPSGRAARGCSRAWSRAPTRRRTRRPRWRRRIATLWDVAAKASALEGEVASHTRKLEALERRGRALRAEIGRKVEELAHEESRVLREAAAYAEEEASAKQELVRAEQIARERGAIADQAERTGQGNRAIFEAAGAASAMVEAQKQWLKTREVRRTAREATAGDLRRQIDELRAQLARYAEALEEDLNSGREKVALAHARGPQVRESVHRRLLAAHEPPQGQGRVPRPHDRAHVRGRRRRDRGNERRRRRSGSGRCTRPRRVTVETRNPFRAAHRPAFVNNLG